MNAFPQAIPHEPGSKILISALLALALAWAPYPQVMGDLATSRA